MKNGLWINVDQLASHKKLHFIAIVKSVSFTDIFELVIDVFTDNLSGRARPRPDAAAAADAHDEVGI